MGNNTIHIRKPILLLLGVTLFILLGLSVLGAYWLQRQPFDKGIQMQLASVQRVFQHYLDRETEHLSVLIDFCKIDKTLQKPYLKKDRDALLHNVLPIFELIRDKDHITHFYFIKPDKTCFLRAHNPSRYGDHIDRFTLDQAIRTGTVAHGVEFGPFGTFTLRVVHPWRIGDELIGYLELGKEIDALSPDLKKILGFEFFFLVNKQHLKREMWEEGLKMMKHAGDWDEIPDHVIINRTMAELPDKINEYIRMPHTKKEGLLFKVSQGTRRYRGGFTPLRDASGQEVGEIIALRDFTEEVSEQMLAAVMAAICIALGSILFAVFYIFVGKTEKRLTQAHNNLTGEIEHRKEAEDKLKEHQNGLEILVEKRTKDLKKINDELRAEITQRLQAEEDLHKQKTILNSIFASSPDMLVFKDESLIYKAVNQAFCEFLGKTQEEIIGKTDIDLFPRPEAEKYSRDDAKVLGLSQPQIQDEEVTGKEGKKWLQVAKVPVRDESGNRIGILCSVHDITERKQTEISLKNSRDEVGQQVAERTAELEKTYKQLLHAEKLSAIGKLSASIAHEFNNPICGIRNVLERLNRKAHLDEKNSKLVELAIKESDRIANLTKDLQAFSKPTSGVAVSVNIHKILDDLLLLSKKIFKAKKIQVEKQYASSMPEIMAVPDQITQVLF